MESVGGLPATRTGGADVRTLRGGRAPRARRRRTLAAAAELFAVAAAFALPIEPAPAASQSDQVTALSQRVHELSFELNETRKTEDKLYTPVAILVSILAAGGALGIVFSFRDQRRISQLHELTVGGEVATQRRTEQGYASFFEQSQTTLSLVNDTLKLAKEANENAARTMKDKAQERVDQIEERAQRLMFDAFDAREFEALIKEPARLSELESVAAELRSLEGYLSLQDVRIRPYTKFVKALDQFMTDDTDAALQALRLASQDGVVADLQRFIEYWLGYLLTTVGEYEEAINRFRHDELSLRRDDPEYFQLERIIRETEFFALAKPKDRDSESGALLDARTPRERFAAVASVLDELAKLAATIEVSGDDRAKEHTILEVVRTLADIFEWVAYDPRHLDEPIDEVWVEQSEQLTVLGWLAGESMDEDAVEGSPPLAGALDGARAFLLTDEWAAMKNEDVVRAWALRQAQAICEEHRERNFDVQFALAECYFKLRDTRADRAFVQAEHIAHEMVEAHHEKRTTASLHESLLISHSRLLSIRRRALAEQEEADEQTDPETRKILSAAREALEARADEEARQIRRAAREAREVVSRMARQGRVTIFSQIQRRNITQDEFKEEISAIVAQDRLRDEVD